MAYDQGYLEKYFPKQEGVALNNYNKNDHLDIKLVPIKEFLYNGGTGYSVYLCEEVLENNVEDFPGTFTISGSFVTPLEIGRTYEAEGKITQYKENNQLRVSTIKMALPENERGIMSFLNSLIHNETYANLIYTRFGNDSIKVIRDSPLEILDIIPTLWDEKVLKWQEELDNIKDDHYIMARLMGYGLKPAQIKVLFNKFGSGILSKVEKNPYFLASSVRNYSFKKCDDIAQIMGLSPSDTSRIEEGVFSCLYLSQMNGNTYMPRDELISSAKETLSLKIGIQEARRLNKNIGTATRALYKYGNMSFEVSKSELEDSIENYQSARTKEEKSELKICVFSPSNTQIIRAIEMLELSNRIYISGDKIFEYVIYQKEINIAYNIGQFKKCFSPITSNIEDYLMSYCKKKGLVLEEKQKEAILGICSGYGGLFILNGSAGCGKTFCLGIALEMLKKLCMKSTGYFDSYIVAPTGKAAQVASKATGLEASTIHRLLRYSPDSGYFYNAKNQLFFNILIVDESSMLDVDLANALFEGIDPETKIVLIGDTKQLPSVGAGNVFKDIIESKSVPIVTLNVVKRQGKDSGIIKNANRIIAGEIPVSEKESDDAYVFRADDPNICVQKIIGFVHKRILIGIDLEDIQILCPQKKGITGTNYMNYILQREFNPVHEGSISFLNREISVPTLNGTQSVELEFRENDKVIHIKNNYNTPWYKRVNNGIVKIDETGIANGECGRIIKMLEFVDEYKNKIKSIFVDYGEKVIRYDDDFSELDLAYALTIHKSQGSQWNSVIIPIMKSNYMMLDREILYTGYTRAQKLCIIVGEKAALETAVKKIQSENRHTALKSFLLA